MNYFHLLDAKLINWILLMRFVLKLRHKLSQNNLQITSKITLVTVVKILGTNFGAKNVSQGHTVKRVVA
jgi:hypothetical protein